MLNEQPFTKKCWVQFACFLTMILFLGAAICSAAEEKPPIKVPSANLPSPNTTGAITPAVDSFVTRAKAVETLLGSMGWSIGFVVGIKERQAVDYSSG